ncbi:MAG: peptidoglycan bridge formation glycyltransferase FemA/FemB family protein [Ardenticatenales bacterium]|nr:peptidoglycan bridge formation glycyltransferase FemA/FemB family protein [Ardenticatenales bacterium]
MANESTAPFLQTAAWGDFKAKWGWQARRVALRREGLLVAGAQVLFRPLPLGRSIAYIPRGPLVPDNDPPLLAALFDEIHRLCRAEGALLLTVEPPWTPPGESPRLMEQLGFRRSTETIQPSATILLDLRPSEEEILGQMHSKWRYNIRLAARKEITVRVGGEGDFDTFHALTSVTGERDAFATRPRGYYEDSWRAFQPNSRLFIAEYQGRALAAILVVKTGKMAIYLYGASSNEERNRMPNHALQWAAMQWARQEGCHWYDFWGIPAEVPDDGQVETLGEGGLWGVYRFKQGFGGKVVKYPGAFDFVYSRLGYFLYQQYQVRRGGGH